MKYIYTIIIVLVLFCSALHLMQTVEASDAVSDAANMTINMGNLDEPKQVAGIVKILLVMTSFTFLPGLLLYYHLQGKHCPLSRCHQTRFLLDLQY